MYQLILHKLQAARCTKRAAEGMRVARRGSKVERLCICVCVFVCACLCARMPVWICVCAFMRVTVVCLFPVFNNYLFGLRAEIFLLRLPFAKGKCRANGNYTNNKSLKDLSPSHKGRIVAERAIKIN